MAGRLPRLRGGGGPLRRRGPDPVAPQQTLDLLGFQPCATSPEGGREHGRRLVGTDVLERHDRSLGSVPPSPVHGGMRERDRRLLREGERRDADRPGPELVRHAACAHERCDDRDRAGERTDGLRDVPGDVRGLRCHRRDVDHDESVDLARARHDPDRFRVLGPTGRGDHVDRVLRGRFGRECPGELRRGLLGEARDREPTRLGRVGALHRETAGVGDDAHPVPLWGGLVREDRGDVEHLLQRVRADHTVLPEQCVQGRVRCDDRGGM